MGKQLLNIVGISTSSLQSNTFALILGIENTKKRIPIIIGAYEAQAIAIELEQMRPSRPLTHDLIRNMLNSFSLFMKEVSIIKFREGIFYSNIKLSDGTKDIDIDSRTSDAVALAVRFNCPIYADDEVINATAMEEEIEAEHEIEVVEEDKEMSIEELEIYLQELIDAENYEEASKVRDIISNLKNKKD